MVPALCEDFCEEQADVLIDGKYIVEIKAAGSILRSDVETIDVAGKTLIPGLFDLHTHLYSILFNPYELQGMSPGKIMFGVYDFAKAYLKSGYTTLRDCGSSHNSVAAVRDAIAGGIVQGPRLISCGLIITPTETGNSTFQDLYHEADGADAMRRACRTELQKENDFIKLMVTGAFMNERGEPGAQIATAEEMRAAVEIASLKDTYVCGHCHGTDAIKEAVRAGIRTIEHGVFIDDEGIQMIRDKEDCFLVPTGAITLYCLDDSNSDLSAELLEKTRYYAERERECVHRAYRAGLMLGFGSDLDMVAFSRVPGYEFTARKEFYGFSDLDIMLQATKYSAKIAKLDHVTGSIKEGKFADLVVVDGNPDEDVRVMQKPIIQVLKEGQLIDL